MGVLEEGGKRHRNHLIKRKIFISFSLRNVAHCKLPGQAATTERIEKCSFKRTAVEGDGARQEEVKK